MDVRWVGFHPLPLLAALGQTPNLMLSVTNKLFMLSVTYKPFMLSVAVSPLC
jgi:hypothetical protein